MFLSCFSSKQSAAAQLASNAALLSDLQASQHDRLSQNPPSHFAQMPRPSAEELALAERVQRNLLRMTGQLQPKDVVPENAVRSLLGIPQVKEEPKATSAGVPPSLTPAVITLEEATALPPLPPAAVPVTNVI